jgi:hypothetical protein
MQQMIKQSLVAAIIKLRLNCFEVFEITNTILTYGW